MNIRKLTAHFALCCAMTGVQATTVITFEELPLGLAPMVNSTGSAIPGASQLTNQYLALNGVSFTSLAGYAALVNHGQGNPSASVPNIIGGTTAGGLLNYDAPITISFFDPANVSISATTDTFKIQGDWSPLRSGSVFATARDANGAVIATTSDTDDKVFGVSGPVLQFSVTGIHSVTISGNNGTVGFDQLEYGNLTPVPEPSTFALLLAGLALAALQRRRTLASKSNMSGRQGTKL